MQRAWVVLGISLLLSGCDARKAVPSDWSKAKSCENSNPDCVFQSATGTTQQICEPSSGQCRVCGRGVAADETFNLATGSAECRTGYSKGLICDGVKFECRSCQPLNQECAKADPTSPICDSGSCRPCSMDKDCQGEGFVTCSAGRCRGCSKNAECIDETKPYCDPGTTACRACQADSECDSQLCDTGKNPAVVEGVGKCAKASSIVWVQNGGCTNGMGSVASPYCSIAEALTNVNAKYLLLKTSGTPYSVPSPLNRNLVLTGQGTTASDVVLSPFIFSGAGQTLVLSKLTVRDTVKTQSLVKCTAGTLVVLKSWLDGGKRGIDADTSCTKVTVEQTRVENASGAGLSIAGTTDYRIVNSIVLTTASTSDFTGVVLSTSKTGKFAFNTVLGNGKTIVPTIPGGVDCGSSPKLLENSLVFQNTLGLGKQFVGTSCQAKSLVVGTDPSAPQGSTMASPMLNGDGTLMPNDTVCADQVDADPDVPVDFFGTARPKASGGKADIGFHEAK